MVVASPITGAAIIGGELILSLPTGQIINCGLVQGPPGLKGEPGAPGPSGKPGLDGNTLLHGQGFPALDIGRDGDFYWMTGPDLAVFGPKIGGSWGSPVYLKQPIVGVNADAVPMAMAGGEGGGSGDGPSKVYTNQVIATGTGRSGKLKETKAGVSYAGSPNGIIPPSAELKVQSNINNWIVSCIERFDAVVPVGMGGILPGSGDYDGDLFYAGDSLFIWSEEHGWQAIGAGDSGPPVFVGENEPPGTPQEGELWYCTVETELTLYIYTGTVWAPAAPPVSLDGIEESIANVDAELLKVNANVAMNKRDIDEAILDVREDQDRQDKQIAELEGEVDDLKPTIERGEWIYNSNPENVNTPAPGEYHAYVVISDDYCKGKLGECLLNAAGDPTEASKCNRENEDCLDKIDTSDSDVPWHEVQWLVTHRNDANGRQHLFGDVVPGMYIEAINTDGTGHGLYLIVGKSLTGVKCGFNVEPVHSTGHPNGEAVIKIFSMAEADPADYVRKAGDTMSGQLRIQPEQSKDTGLVVFAGKGSLDEDKTVVFAVTNTKGHEILRVHNHGRLRVGSSAIDYNIEHDSDLVTKKYVDSIQGPATHKWMYKPDKDKTNLQVGEFTGPVEPKYGQATNHHYYFHPESLTAKMGFYKDVDFYFPMNAAWGTFHFFGNDGIWKIKQFVPVRNLKMFLDDNYLEIKTHTDYPEGNSDSIISKFIPDQYYYFSIGGMI